MAGPLLRRVVGLDGEHAVTGFLGATTQEEAPRPRLRADTREFRERHPVERGDLLQAGRVHRWLYATAGRGALGYYTLSRLGWQLLHCEEQVTVPKRSFCPVGVARQFHSLSLADFIVHTAVAAHRDGIILTGFYRENAI